MKQIASLHFSKPTDIYQVVPALSGIILSYPVVELLVHKILLLFSGVTALELRTSDKR